MDHIKTIIVDDIETMHTALREFVEEELNHKVIAEAYNGLEFLELNNNHTADIILMDVEMPVMDGIEAAKKVLWDYPYLRIIAITMYQEKVYLQKLIEAGFKGCIFKQNIFHELERAVSTVMNDKIYFPDNIKL